MTAVDELLGKSNFEASNLYILEDLNARGFATYPSEVANAKARELGNGKVDTDVNEKQETLWD